jgi:oxygen-independent coproporphyrinogen-3 oxidase
MGSSLIQKYNVPGPRYTSYPTVPHWNNPPTQQQWANHVSDAFTASNNAEGISLYIHLPYCESLCTYCGCNMRVSKNHKVEIPYIDTVIQEWQLYSKVFNEAPIIKEIHLGGGTPTFFSPKNLKYLITEITKNAVIAENHEFSFEAHPKNTSKEHLQTLFNLGFERLSLGIQDFDPKVQEIINRHQPYEMVEEVVNNARKIGYSSINFDLIYGLPLQTKTSVIGTIEKVQLLKPDRIAFYSYAHVPWVKGGQRKFTEADLPKNEEKRELYDIGKKMFEDIGYSEVGMDHFALPKDPLFTAINNNTLHRNFMGYTANSTTLMVGLGASSISDSWSCFFQNVKSIEEYKALVAKNEFPVLKGHILTKNELTSRKHILNMMCHFNTVWQKDEHIATMVAKNIDKLKEMEAEGLLQIKPSSLQVTEKGKLFVRNICMLLDPKIERKSSQKNTFSSTI